MNKIYYCFILLLLLLLASCNHNPLNEFDEFIVPALSDAAPDYADTQVITIEDAFTPTWIHATWEEMPFQYSNMFSSTFGAVIWDTPDALLFVTEASGSIVLMEYVKSTGRLETFCKLAVCNHRTDECPAGNVMDNLMFADGRLSALRLRDPSRLEFWISELYNGRFQYVAGPIAGFIRGSGAYYAITPDRSLVRFADGSNNPEIILYEFPYIKPVIINGWLYASSETQIIRINLYGSTREKEILVVDVVAGFSSDGRYLYYNKMEDGQLVLYRSDLNGENPEVILRDTNVFTSYLSFCAYYIYYTTFFPETEYTDIYRLPKDLSKEPEHLSRIYAPTFVYVLPTSPDTLLLRKHDGFILKHYFMSKINGELVRLVHTS